MDRCTPEKKKECVRNSGPHIEMLCSTCELKDPPEQSVWFRHIWYLYSLQRGGFPFEADDLTIEEWQDLGLLREQMEIWRTRSRLS